MPSAAYPATDRTTPTRARHRVTYDREAIHEILDSEFLCHLGIVRDGEPLVLPMLYARRGEHLYLHGSTGSRPLRDAGEEKGIPVCATVTCVDGLVLARSAMHHSLNYRCLVIRGTAHRVTREQERREALDALTDAVAPGRAADCRPADARELAATAVLRVALEEVSLKSRTGGPNEDEQDAGREHWSGVIPLTRSHGRPLPADDLTPGVTLPPYLTALTEGR